MQTFFLKKVTAESNFISTHFLRTNKCIFFIFFAEMLKIASLFLILDILTPILIPYFNPTRGEMSQFLILKF